jgi:predicted amidohydrolase
MHKGSKNITIRTAERAFGFRKKSDRKLIRGVIEITRQDERRLSVIKVALLQFAPRFGDREFNLRRAAELARSQRADIYVLPELCTTGYQFRDRREAYSLAEQAAGESVEFFHALARQLSAWFAFGLAERQNERVFNSAALVGPKGPEGIYRKIHLFSREKTLFDPGDRPWRVYSISPARVGLMICFDWFFPEAARTLALDGAQLIAHPANLVLPFCQQAMITRALENQVFCATANRVGREERWADQPLRFTGQSRLVGPQGEVLAQAGEEEEGALAAAIDPARADDKVVAGNDLFADRRPEFYGAVCRGR